MTTTPEAIRDLVKQLRAECAWTTDGQCMNRQCLIDAGWNGVCPIPLSVQYKRCVKSQAADRMVQLLTAVEEAERVIEPFALLCDDITNLSAHYDDEMGDPNNWSKSCTWEELVRARDWLAKHRSAGR